MELLVAIFTYTAISLYIQFVDTFVVYGYFGLNIF